MPINEPQYEVVWPLGRFVKDQGSLAPRMETMEGKRVGFIWDYMFQGDDAFDILEHELKQRYPAMEFVGHGMFGNIHGPDERAVVDALPDLIAMEGVHAVIVGVGH